MSKLSDLARVVLRDVLRHRRNAIVMPAIAAAVLLVTLLSGMLAGISAQIERLTEVSFTGDLMLVNSSASVRSSPMPFHAGWDEMLDGNAALALEKDPGVSAVYKRLVLMGSMMGGDTSSNVYMNIIGCEFGKEEGYSFRALLKFDSRETNSPGVFVSRKAADKLGLKVGDDAYLFIPTVNGLSPAKFRVAGTFTGKGSPGITESLVYVDYQDLARALGLTNGECSFALVSLKDKGCPDRAMERLKNVLPAGCKLLPPSVTGRFYNAQKAMYGLVTGAAIGLLVISVFLFIYSALIMAVHSRKREIGTLSSMGFPVERIFLIFTLEGTLIGLMPALAGGLLGAVCILALSIGGIPAVNEAMRYGIASDVLVPRIDWAALAAVAAGIGLTAFAGSVPPTLQIVRLKPVEALADR